MPTFRLAARLGAVALTGAALTAAMLPPKNRPAT